jgi:hypothetical protein
LEEFLEGLHDHGLFATQVQHGLSLVDGVGRPLLGEIVGGCGEEVFPGGDDLTLQQQASVLPDLEPSALSTSEIVLEGRTH